MKRNFPLSRSTKNQTVVQRDRLCFELNQRGRGRKCGANNRKVGMKPLNYWRLLATVMLAAIMLQNIWILREMDHLRTDVFSLSTAKP